MKFTANGISSIEYVVKNRIAIEEKFDSMCETQAREMLPRLNVI